MPGGVRVRVLVRGIRRARLLGGLVASVLVLPDVLLALLEVLPLRAAALMTSAHTRRRRRRLCRRRRRRSGALRFGSSRVGGEAKDRTQALF